MALNRFATGIEDACKAKEEYMIRNGALLLEKQILYGHGKESNSRPVRIFSIKEIQNTTNDFDDPLIFDRKATTKYKGTLGDGRVVAIESPWGPFHLNRSVVELFLNQVAVNQIINHKNVVKLHGYCIETVFPILVHEFLPNKTLHDHILDFSIPWSDSLRIAADISHTLSYMHLALSKPIVHLDIASYSIYLDESFNAKLGNFGSSDNERSCN